MCFYVKDQFNIEKLPGKQTQALSLGRNMFQYYEINTNNKCYFFPKEICMYVCFFASLIVKISKILNYLSICNLF